MSGTAASSGVKQWLRKISLTAADLGKDGIELASLRIRFTVTAMTIDMPATLNARIYNLSQQTTQKLLNLKTIPAGRGVSSTTPGDNAGAAKITLQAGYEGNYGIIFKGDLIQPRAGRESVTDTYVDLFAGDGDWAHVWGKVNRTLAAGYTPGDVNDEFKNALSQYGLTVNDLPQDVPQTAAPRGKVMYGMARDYRRDMARTYNLTAYPRQGVLEWLPQSSVRPGDIVEVNSRTGMINLPQQTTYGMTVQMLLNPSVGPGTLLRVNNKSIQRGQFVASRGGAVDPNLYLNQSLNADDNADGAYKVLGVDHTGDTRGNEWYTTAVCIATAPTGEGDAGGRASVQARYGTAWQ